MKQIFPALSLGLASLGLISTLNSCSSPTPIATPTPSIASSSLATPISASPTPITPPTSALANITEIRKQPVWVRPTDAAPEISAQEGMGLQFGETIRTQGEAMAQVNLKNGLAFRIRGDASLKLQPNNHLNLTAGDMITWVQPGQTVPAEIITPTAVAGIRGTTVFVRIPVDPQGETEFFSWEGTVAVRLVGQTKEILLKTGDEVKIKRGETDINQIRQRVRRFTPQEFAERRRKGRLLRGFNQPLPTLKIIETLKPGQVLSDLKGSKANLPLAANLKRQSLKQQKQDLKQPAAFKHDIKVGKKAIKAMKKRLQKAKSIKKRPTSVTSKEKK